MSLFGLTVLAISFEIVSLRGESEVNKYVCIYVLYVLSVSPQTGAITVFLNTEYSAKAQREQGSGAFKQLMHNLLQFSPRGGRLGIPSRTDIVKLHEGREFGT